MRRALPAFLSVVLATSFTASPVVVHAQEDLPMLTGLPGGQAESRTCPDEAVMTGLRARVGLMVDAIGIRCRRIKPDGTLGSSEFDDGSMMGGTGGNVRVSSCTAGSVIVGQRLGRSLVPPYGLVRLSFYCRGWSPGLRTAHGPTVIVDVLSLPTAPSSSSYYCSSPGRPVRRVRTMAGIYVNAAGFTCLTP